MCKLPMHGRNLYKTFLKLISHDSRKIINKIKVGENTETRVCLWFSRLASLLQH